VPPDNSDFTILEPTWLALVLVAYDGLAFVIIVPAAVASVLYLGGRALFYGTLSGERAQRIVLVGGRVVGGIVTLAAAVSAGAAIVDIATA